MTDHSTPASQPPAQPDPLAVGYGADMEKVKPWYEQTFASSMPSAVNSFAATAKVAMQQVDEDLKPALDILTSPARSDMPDTEHPSISKEAGYQAWLKQRGLTASESHWKFFLDQTAWLWDGLAERTPSSDELDKIERFWKEAKRDRNLPCTDPDEILPLIALARSATAGTNGQGPRDFNTWWTMKAIEYKGRPFTSRRDAAHEAWTAAFASRATAGTTAPHARSKRLRSFCPGTVVTVYAEELHAIADDLDLVAGTTAPAPSDEQIVAALHACGIDTRPSKYGFDALQIDGTSVPNLRNVFAKLYPAASAVPGDLPPLPYMNYNGYSDGSEPLYTAEQMRDYGRACRAPSDTSPAGTLPDTTKEK